MPQKDFEDWMNCHAMPDSQEIAGILTIYIHESQGVQPFSGWRSQNFKINGIAGYSTHLVGANPCPPIGSISICSPNSAIHARPLLIASCTEGSASDDVCLSFLFQISVTHIQCESFVS